MGFRGQPFAFDSPAAAVAAMIARTRTTPLGRPAQVVPLDIAAGRVLAHDVHADRDSPPFDHSAMDGYAVCCATLAPHAGSPTIPVVGESRIGEPPPPLRPPPEASDHRPFAVRLATGAPIPDTMDAVVRREDVAEYPGTHAGEVVSISLTPEAKVRLRPGDHIRRKGENAKAGTPILHAGEALSASALATLAAVGVTRPSVFRQLRIALITTGDELVDPMRTPSPFQTRNSNAPAVRAILESHAWATVVGVSHVRDEDDLAGVLGRACQAADAVVLTGGVSMGHRDPVRAAVDAVASTEILFHGLPQRPGKPMLGAVLTPPGQNPARPIPIFGLPGNPVSALVTCTRIVLPVLAACAGATRTPPACLPRLIEVRNPDARALDLWWHRLVRVVPDADGTPHAQLIDARGSGDVVAAGSSDGFVEIPPSTTPAPAPTATGTFLPLYSWPAGPIRTPNDVGEEMPHA